MSVSERAIKLRRLYCAFASVIAGEGDGVEFVAQWVASAMVVDLDAEEGTQFFYDVTHRIFELVKSQDLIWPGLLPGGPMDEESYTMMDQLSKLADPEDAKPGVQVVLVATFKGGEAGDVWIVADEEMTLYEWSPVVYVNVSRPSADSTEPGDVLIVPHEDFGTGEIKLLIDPEMLKQLLRS